MKKAKNLSEKEKAKAGVYKGYDVKWLRENPSHPDFGLVAEFDKKYNKIK